MPRFGRLGRVVGVHLPRGPYDLPTTTTLRELSRGLPWEQTFRTGKGSKLNMYEKGISSRKFLKETVIGAKLKHKDGLKI